MPPGKLIKKSVSLANQWTQAYFADRYRRWLDLNRSTYSPVSVSMDVDLLTYLPPFDLKLSQDEASTIAALSQLYCEHTFDLLGSGWITVKHGLKCRGLAGHLYSMGASITPDLQGRWLAQRINHANIATAQAVWKLVDTGYQPIDWHLDFKSGYRWSETTWYLDVQYAHQPGVDIKVPWELGRMQHLPMLAWAYAGATQTDSKSKIQWFPPHVYSQEFHNQILDFIATNPPRFGVNWRCTMDVGIRIVNWLVAYDLFLSHGMTWDSEFEAIFKQSVYDHGVHIIHNLEWNPNLRSNHYLSDIAGLLFVAAYLPRSGECDSWLAFAVQEFIAEVALQFHSDGSNFEASTSYHRLSAEIVLYCAALCCSLPNKKRQALVDYVPAPDWEPALHPYSEQAYDIENPHLLPDWLWERLEKAGEFTHEIIKPNSYIPQFGDNDSGRFLKLWPTYRQLTVAEAVATYQNLQGYDGHASEVIYWDEVLLDHRHLTRNIGVLLERPDLRDRDHSETADPEMQLLRAWSTNCNIPSYHSDRQKAIPEALNVSVGCDRTLNSWLTELKQSQGEPFVSHFRCQPFLSTDDPLRIFAYPNFGLYLYKNSRIYLAIRCGSNGQNGNGGHAHNDQLSLELEIDGQTLICDPGTYLYTPLPEQRNLYRSTQSHFTPQHLYQEQNDWLPGALGLFSLKDQAEATCLYFSIDGFVGRHYGFSQPIHRIVTLEAQQVSVFDFGGDPATYQVQPFSNGYGRVKYLT
ncbi:heparinase II/III family protein [Acaryochloris sp. 'Moss Beach']|uniref:heparinase II/III family protein n=1 Tax=Acaryochloris sp. 'Moss Beach' TaxID=2740837 RepID=UPI001F1A4D35|nr:heparinase II/III family protein [Acaryochloris sp. 'Moss Beach']UJB69473.1 heparinase II/III family protein [Acaryochloris sp. 'Moss Beach']